MLTTEERWKRLSAFLSAIGVVAALVFGVKSCTEKMDRDTLEYHRVLEEYGCVFHPIFTPRDQPIHNGVLKLKSVARGVLECHGKFLDFPASKLLYKELVGEQPLGIQDQLKNK